VEKKRVLKKSSPTSERSVWIFNPDQTELHQNQSKDGNFGTDSFSFIFEFRTTRG
jgi:hypothetical protein